MDKVLAVLTLLTEMLMVLQCLQIAFKQELRFDKYLVGILLINIVVYLLINFKVLPVIFSVIVYAFLFGYCHYVVKQKIVKTLIKLIVGLSLSCCIEVIMAYITNIFSDGNDSIFILFLSSVMTLLLSYVIKKKIPLLESKSVNKSNVVMIGIIIFYGLTIGGLLVDYYLNQSLIKIYAAFRLFFIVCMFFYLYRLEQAQNEIEKQNYELELQKIYGETYEKLLIEVRRRQHDFKNQLGTLYSMQLVAQSLEELVNMQKEYGNKLQADCKFDSILTCCNNVVLAGFLYYRCISCDKEGINIDYDIHIDQAKCRFALHEIIEILGILIDNACEYFVLEQADHKRIGLMFLEDEEKIIFSVSNPAKYISFSEIEKMFIRGYSSKGQNRGIGLARVLELVKKYESDIHVFNARNSEENWIIFKIEIIK